MGIYRFLLALNVVIFHLLGVPAIGPYAVFSFFVLSGFLMTLVMKESYGYSISGFSKYALNRFLRLFPIYWILLFITLLSIIIIGDDNSKSFHQAMFLPKTISEWFGNLSLIFWSEKPIEVIPRIAPATWALTIELFFYLIIGLGISSTKASTILWFGLSLCYTIYFNLTVHIGLGYGTVWLASLPFSLGALAYHFREEIINTIRSLRETVLLFIVYVSNLLLASFSSVLFGEDISWKVGFLASVLNLAVSAFLTVYLFHIDKTLNRSWNTFLGNLSYPVYVFHWGGALIAAAVFDDFVKESRVLIFGLGLFITLIISCLAEYYLSKNIEKLRTRIKS
jgi:peptidoglycan/LPS O-acetylase OafA/YrhL